MSKLRTLAPARLLRPALLVALGLPLLASVATAQQKMPNWLDKKLSTVTWSTLQSYNLRYLRIDEYDAAKDHVKDVTGQISAGNLNNWIVMMTIPGPEAQIDQANEIIGVIVTPVGGGPPMGGVPPVNPTDAIWSWIWILGIALVIVTVVLGLVWSKCTRVCRKVDAS